MPYKRGSQWIGQVVQILPDGRKKNLSHRSATKREAIEWEEAKRREIQHGGPCQTRTVSLHEWATAYLDFAKDRFVKKTYEEKRLAFRELFKSSIPDLLADNFNGKMALDSLENCSRSKGGNTANKRRKNLRAAWAWGIKFLNLPKDNPFDAVPRFAEVRDERHVPTIQDFWKVLSLVDRTEDRHMLLCFLYTGARRDEVFRLKWRDVDFSKKRIRLETRKNSVGEWTEAWLPISGDLEDALRKQRQITGLLGNVFMWQAHDRQWLPYQYRQHWLKKLCKRAGVEPFGFHGIRHLFASILASKNVPLVEIQKMLRHGSIQTTAKYIHSLQKEGSREAIEALPSLKEAMG